MKTSEFKKATKLHDLIEYLKFEILLNERAIDQIEEIIEEGNESLIFKIKILGDSGKKIRKRDFTLNPTNNFVIEMLQHVNEDNKRNLERLESEYRKYVDD